MKNRFYRVCLMAVLFTLGASRAQAALVNSSFEVPDLGAGPTVSQANPAAVPGWSTTDVSIEIWANGFNGVTSYDGTQHAEINAFINGTLFQDAAGIAAGQQVGFEFAHRARVGTDVMRLTITDLGLDNLLGGGDDTTLFTKMYSADTSAWVFNTSAGEAPIFALGNNVRFAYSAVSTGSGSPSVGNFLDAADFGVGVAMSPTAVPEPAAATLGLMGLGVLGMATRRRAA